MLFVGNTFEGFFILNITDIQNPLFISKLLVIGDTDSIKFSRKNQSFIALGWGIAGIYLLDIKQLFNLRIKNKIDHKIYLRVCKNNKQQYRIIF